jgi:hypothetical protein
VGGGGGVEGRREERVVSNTHQRTKNKHMYDCKTLRNAQGMCESIVTDAQQGVRARRRIFHKSYCTRFFGEIRSHSPYTLDALKSNNIHKWRRAP